jgi:23S rRNA (cytidine1920-2'-O)/16S rRNA (cytidine1409-2'-O)-methyltransferase
MRRRLDAELVRRGLVPSRAQATEAITAGRVLVDGGVATTAARQVAPDEAIALHGPPRTYVSRGGEKLLGALERFSVVVDGRRALDAGASTGGFTDCLLRHGASHVYAIDVGHGQLAWSLRTDARVTTVERTNLRSLQPSAIDVPVPLGVADLSFISLLTVAPALHRCTTDDADLILLVKPQFEAGRERVGRRGVVRDPSVHAEVLVRVGAGLAEHGLVVVDAMPSPLLGPQGNREFFVHCRHAGDGLGSGLSADALAAVAAPAGSHP